MRSHELVRRLRAPALAGGLLLMALAGAVGTSAAGEVNTGYFGDVAIRGYDTVAYFTQGQAVKGSRDLSYKWLGATWYFASAEHREMFAQDPTKFAPQYGGHCADGVAMGTITTNIDPTAWRIIEGKLYLNYDPGAAGGFAQKEDKVQSADKNWPQLRAMLLSAKQPGQ
jgi:YHS domain-containing protein